MATTIKTKGRRKLGVKRKGKTIIIPKKKKKKEKK